MSVDELGFRDPWVLWFLCMVPALCFLWTRRDQERIKRARQLGISATFDRWGLVVVGSIAVISIVSLARPYIGREIVKLGVGGRDIVALLDVSTSMLAADESPSRLAAARRKVLDLAAIARTQGDRVGIVLFAGDAYLFCPLTVDSAVIELYLDAVEPSLLGSAGSSIERAVSIGLDTLRSAQAQSGAILLLSDGEDESASADAIADLLRSSGVPLYALGFGSTEGRAIDIGGGRMVRDTWGNLVLSRRNDSLLTAIAEGSGGDFLLPTADDVDLRSFFPSRAKPTSDQSDETRDTGIETFREVGSWGALTVLGLLLAYSVVARRFPLLLLPVLLFTPADRLFADDSIRTAIEAYEAEEFEQAALRFSEAVRRKPDDAALRRALGTSQYRAGDYSSAAESFDKGAQLATTGRERFFNRYNQGNALLRAGRALEASRAYEEALALKPGDEDTEHNLALARELLRRTPTPQPDPSPAPSPLASPTASASGTETPSSTPETAPTPSATADGTGTPTAGPTVGGTPATTPTASAGEEGERTPTPAPGGDSTSPTPHPSPTSNSGGDGTPEPTVTPAGEGTSATRTPLPIETVDPNETPTTAQQEPLEYDPRALKEEEAELWLRSLGETPLMTRRQRRSLNLGGQTW